MKFKHGDRVAVYDSSIYGTRARATIENPKPGKFVTVRLNPKDTICVTYQQCRLLKKKKRRHIWVHENALKEERTTPGGWVVGLKYPTDHGDGPWLEFAEVKKK